MFENKRFVMAKMKHQVNYIYSSSGVGAVATVAAMVATLFTNVNLLMFIVINIHKLLIMNNN